ncbi:MAG: response regulator [Magnetococcales bacterium]|nr:response regulator [Magnetococcales bacterium]
MNILIVDDNEPLRENLKAILQPYGECTLVEDGETAVQTFQAALRAGNPFKLVLLDIVMPGIDGKEALLQIRRMEKELYGAKHQREQSAHILMQTSMHRSDQMLSAFSKGCDGYVMKPVDKEKLLARLSKSGIIPPLDAETGKNAAPNPANIQHS